MIGGRRQQRKERRRRRRRKRRRRAVLEDPSGLGVEGEREEEKLSSGCKSAPSAAAAAAAAAAAESSEGDWRRWRRTTKKRMRRSWAGSGFLLFFCVALAVLAAEPSVAEVTLTAEDHGEELLLPLLLSLLLHLY